MPNRLVTLLGALLVAVASLVAGTASAAPLAQQALSCDGSEGVYLYENFNFQGRCLRFTADAPDLSAFAFNNAASSVRVVGNYTGVLYVDQNYGNVASAFGADNPDLRGTLVDDNRGSAIRIIRGYRQTNEQNCRGDGVYLYEGTRYTGRCVRYAGDEADLSRQAFNNQASSVRIVGNYSVRLYVDQNYGGVEVVLSQSIEDLNSTALGNRRASAIRVGSGGPNNCNGADGVYLYEHPNYQGRCVRLQSDAGDLRVLGFDDTASSIRFIGSGWTATLFRDLNGTGLNNGFSADDPNLADNPIGDNQATSVRVTRGGAPQPTPVPQPQPVPGGLPCDGGEGVYLYEHPNYQGRCLRLQSGAGDLRVFGFDDIASSVRIVGGWTATLFRDLTGSGASSRFTASDPNLADDTIGDNQATSVAVARTTAPAPAPAPAPSGAAVGACDGSEGVYLYEDVNYQGACIRLTGSVPDLRAYNLDDAVSSVRVFGRWTVVLYRDLSYTGASSTYTESDPDLRNDGIGGNQATSVQVVRR
jgi:hypothetical protein